MLLLVICLPTNTLFTTFAKIPLVRYASFRGVVRPLRPDACPTLDPVCDPVHVRLCIQSESAELVATLTALVEYFSLIPILGITSDQDSHFLTTPAMRRTGSIRALEFSHDVSRVFVVGCFIVVLITKPWRETCFGDCSDHILMK